MSIVNLLSELINNDDENILTLAQKLKQDALESLRENSCTSTSSNFSSSSNSTKCSINNSGNIDEEFRNLFSKFHSGEFSANSHAKLLELFHELKNTNNKTNLAKKSLYIKFLRLISKSKNKLNKYGINGKMNNESSGNFPSTFTNNSSFSKNKRLINQHPDQNHLNYSNFSQYTNSSLKNPNTPNNQSLGHFGNHSLSYNQSNVISNRPSAYGDFNNYTKYGKHRSAPLGLMNNSDRVFQPPQKPQTQKIEKRPNQNTSNPVISEAILYDQILNVMRGVEQKYIKKSKAQDAYRLTPNANTSRRDITIVHKLAEAGWHHDKICEYKNLAQHAVARFGKTGQSLGNKIDLELNDYYNRLSELGGNWNLEGVFIVEQNLYFNYYH